MSVVTLAQHSAATPEHYTPTPIIEAARLVMGGIDLDPATSAMVNRETVRAAHFWTRADDGLSCAWAGRVWLNPPGGVTKGKSNAAIWWAKLAREYLSLRVEQALFLGFSIEIMATAQDAELWPGELPFCVPRQRLEFMRAIEPGGAPGVGHLFEQPEAHFEAGDSPTHSNVIVYMPPRDFGTTTKAVGRFERYFSRFGRVRT